MTAAVPRIRVDAGRRCQHVAYDCRICKQRAQRRPGLGVEVRDVLFQRHRQHSIDLAPHLHGGSSYQQIRALRHTRHDPQLGIGEATFQVGEEGLDLAAQLRNVRGMRIAMAGHTDDER